jgi:lipoyl(octanoyl) transferase
MDVDSDSKRRKVSTASGVSGVSRAAPLPELCCLRLGLLEYRRACSLQKGLEKARLAGDVPDLLLLLEHPPVYTQGRRSTSEELPMGEDWYRLQGIDVIESDRGGRVTYHGPGQLVGYTIMSLRPYRDDIHDYIRRMERVMIRSLAEYGIDAGLEEGLTGVWTADRRKIASIGVHVSRGITTHGFAINVNNDLQPFEWIVPCGIDHCQMSSVVRETRQSQDMSAFMDVVCREFGHAYERRPVTAPPEQVSQLIAHHARAIPGTSLMPETAPA